jgi:hypothetical protein
MTNTGDIRIDLSAIEEDLEVRGHDSCQIEFVPGPLLPAVDGMALLTAASVAVGAANGAGGADQAMWGQSPFLTLAGTAVTLKDFWGPATLARWLDAFSGSLQSQGYSGRIGAAPSVMPPQWWRHGQEPRATAFVALDHPLTDRVAARTWCRQATDWAAVTGGYTHLQAGPILQHDPGPDAAEHLAAALCTNGSAILANFEPSAPRAQRVWGQSDGLAVHQAYDPAQPWAVLVDSAREAVVNAAERTLLAFVAMTPLWAYGWEHRGRDLPDLPTVPAYRLRQNSPVWGRRVPDAHGIQLLTSAHLDQANDLSAWSIVAVARDRFLVQARDLDAWFTTGAPSAAIVEQARADFGRLIISPQDLD